MVSYLAEQALIRPTGSSSVTQLLWRRVTLGLEAAVAIEMEEDQVEKGLSFTERTDLVVIFGFYRDRSYYT